MQSSLDSILTFSDYDQDTDPEGPRSKAEALLGVRLHSAESRRRQDAPAGEISPSLESLSLEARHSQRRSSEPAIAYAARFCPYISAGEEEELTERPSSYYKPRGRSTRRGAALEASSSSLSSPAPTGSSLDSLDSLSAKPTKPTHPPSSSVSPAPLPRSALIPTVHSKDPAAKEPLHKGALKGCLSLHPNSWLKKDRRLSLTQQDGLEDDDDKTGVRKILNLLKLLNI